MSYKLCFGRADTQQMEEREINPLDQVHQIPNLDRGARYEFYLSGKNGLGWGQEAYTYLDTPEGDKEPEKNDDEDTEDHLEKKFLKKDEEERFCVCYEPYDGSFMIECSLCLDWFHPKCVNMSKDEIKFFSAPEQEYFCPRCLQDHRKSLKELEENPQQKPKPQQKKKGSAGIMSMVRQKELDLKKSKPKKPNQATPENTPKTPGKRGRKRKELCNKRGRKKLIPDYELDKSNLEIIVNEDNVQESDTVEDECAIETCAIDTSEPLPVEMVDKNKAQKSPVQADEKLLKPAVSEETNNVEANAIKTFSDKLPTEWSVNDVYDFVRSIPTFEEFADFFKTQEIDGKALLLLKVDHIVHFTSMKFGPALKLISFIDDIKKKYSLEV